MERIEVDIDKGVLTLAYGFNQHKTQVLRPAKLRLNSPQNRWEGSISQLGSIIELVKNAGLYLKLSKECQKLTGVNEFGLTQEELEAKRHEWDGHPSYISETPEDFDPDDYGFRYGATPYPYQAAGIDYGVKVANGRCIIADQMGLGKTLQSIAIASYYRDSWPLVVVAPASLLYNWKKELLTWLDWLEDSDIYVMGSTSERPKGLVTICSYHYIHANLPLLKEYMNTRGTVIFDEAHSIKNAKSLRGGAGVELAHHAKKCLMVTGTPILSRPIEMFSLLHSVDPIEWDDEEEFARRYCEGHWSELPNKTRIWYDKGSCNLDELMRRSRDMCMVRRLKKDVLSQLPPKRRYPITLNTCTNDNSMDEFMEAVKSISVPILMKNGFNLKGTVTQLRSKMSSGSGDRIFEAYEKSGIAKTPQIVSYISDQLDSNPDEPLIIFVHHQKVLKEIEDSLVKTFPKLEYIKIDGKVADKKKRFDMAEHFQSNPDCKVALLTIGAASVGLTLTKSSRVIMAQMPWTPSISLQAEDRAHRIGQTEDVDIIYLLGNNGFDDYLWSMLVRKSDASNEALDGIDGELFEASDDMDDFSSDDLLTSLVEVIIEDVRSGAIDPQLYAV
ncbi:DEAD/DEAH box helicase [Vibrio crassostreae]|uniref:DEAD/DEAH box helicase n=1 Tax=Vibrio crassostreae TaxID=246167 RepID=UPI001B300733|nr:DEAD/DEAH box helicase [Vibrio crassostreae]